MTITAHIPTRLLLTAALALGLIGGLAGCSGSGDDRPDAHSSSTASTGIGADWGTCMRSAGFDVEDPSDDLVRSGTVLAPQGVDQERYAAAADRCSSAVGVERKDSAAQDSWARQYERVASCIRDEYPDYPEQPEGTLGLSPEDYPRATESGFQEKADACLEEFSPGTKTQQAG
ncbi:hypothetical protein [Curtobacterium sp. MCSS17_015]|uniref:hypothetical protein n=1 Tax=Curtobacterium sp. MCSS17_015 TaxID=2175666 RepID=UPI0011B80A95|nr:hypothetical protein [Curtobacterium sp. MCSS17_015]WIB26948.1 hypothetical protein DEJ18_02315 [Curtobacterium sp. MCSS17_015]